jgi:hypothetical protein
MSNGQPDDRLRARAEESRAKLWLLLEADRRLVTGLVLAVIFLSLVVLGGLVPNAAARLQTSDPIETLFQALVTATITVVTLVLTLNQLVLSQELGAVGDQRERMQGALAFREDAADALGVPVSPARPSQFLRGFVEVAGERSETLRSEVADDTDLAAAVEDLTDSLIGNASRVSDELADAQFGEFEVVSAALDFNYSWKIYTAQRIRNEYAGDLSAEASETLDALIETLELFGPAREHFKTLYFQWELINLSRSILAAAIPALVTSIAVLMFVDASSLTGAVFGVPLIAVFIAAATALTLWPFAVLLAYVVRIATVTKHTLSIGPFILRDTDQVEPVEWD